MSKRWTAMLATLGAAIVIGSGALLLAGARPAPTHPSHSARRLGPLAHGMVGFALNLRLHEPELDAYLRHVRPRRPGSVGLTAARFGTRFGLSARSLGRLRARLGGIGISVTRVYPQRTEMLVRGDVRRIDRIFDLHFGRYVTASGGHYFAAEGRPDIPGDLTPYVTGLGDLSNAPLPADDVPAGGLTPRVLARAYDIDSLWNRGYLGQGQTIAVATDFGAVNPQDMAEFANQMGMPAPHVEVRQVDGGSTYSQQQGSDDEVDLDLQMIASVAPRAHIIDYQGSDGSSGQAPSLGHSLADIYNRIEQDGRARIVTASYGLCESVLAQQSAGDQQLIDNSLKALEASGVSVFVATGDSGAYACLQAAQIEPASQLAAVFESRSVQAPASSPYVISVGGTRLELRADGDYLAESAWSDPLSRLGGGGGMSDSEHRPVWQQGPGVIEPPINPHGARQIPDVAGPADPNSGFEICQTVAGAVNPQCSPGYGGTSAAAPFWAASLALIEQYAAGHGAGRLASCFAAPVLYDLAARHQAVAPFHPVTLGNNGYWPATSGWNYATGLGSPDVFNLAQDYAAFLHDRAAGACPF